MLLASDHPLLLSEHGQPRRAVKRLIQYVHAHGLNTGDSLPPQTLLRQQLGFSNDTMNVAMRVLVERRVLTRRRKSGTRVADRDAMGALGWNIGLGTIRSIDEAGVPFYAELCLHLQTLLADAGCRCRTYHRLSTRELTPLNQFGGLVDDVRSAELDGLIFLTTLESSDWRRLKDAGMAVCHLPQWENAPCGVVIDQHQFGVQAVALLKARGCKRPAVVYSAGPDVEHRRFWSGLDQGLAEAGLKAEKFLTGWGLAAPAAVRQMAQTVRALPPDERPDGFVVHDDRVAVWVTEVLSQIPGYQPFIVVQTTRQQPWRYFLPIIRLEVDLTELAKESARILIDRVKNPALGDEVVWVAPRLAEGPVGVEAFSQSISSFSLA